MAKRYELSDASWEMNKDLVSPQQNMGRPRSDDRLVLHEILWILCSGAAWRALPERLGLGRRCISAYVTAAMTVRATGYWSACTINSTRGYC